MLFLFVYLKSLTNKAEFKKELNIKNLKSIYKLKMTVLEIDEKVFLETLGEELVAIDRQTALTKGKYNLILDVQFKVGQFCRFSKLLSIDTEDTSNLFTPTMF